ncbi:hypothetical protein Tco_0126611 [Tanacetum coccineum]
MSNVKKYVAERTHHKRRYDRRINERQMQSKESKDVSSKALDASLVVSECSRTKSDEHITSSSSGTYITHKSVENDRIEDRHIARNWYSAQATTELRILQRQDVVDASSGEQVALDEEQLLFLAGGQDNVVDEDVEESSVQDLALNVDNVFQADDYDAFDSDVNEAPTAQTMFMASLSSADHVYDEVGPSYDSDVISEKYTTVVTERKGFEQTKECYLTEVIPFFKTLKEHFEGIQKDLTKEIKEMKDVFEEFEAEVDQNIVDRKHDEIEWKNLLIANDNLIVDCLSKEVFYIATNSELNVSRFTKMHDAYTVVQARCLELEAELSELRNKIQNDDHNELVNRFSNLEVNHLNLQLKYQNLKESFGNNPPLPARDTPDFDSVFLIGKMKGSLQVKDNVIKKLKMQIFQLKETRSEEDCTLDFRALDF